MAVYGNDFGNLQANVLGEQALRQRGLENALHNALGALSQARDRQIRSDEFTKSLAANKASQDAQIEAHREQWKAIIAADADRKAAEAEHLRSMTDKLSPEDSRKLGFRIALAQAAAGQGESVKSFGLPKDYEGPLEAVAMANDAKNVLEYNRSQGLARALNSNQDLDAKIAQAQQENKNLESAWIMSGDHRALRDNNNLLIQQWQAEKAHNKSFLQPFVDAKVLEHHVQPSMDNPGYYESAHPLPFSLRKRDTAQDVAPAPQAQDNAGVLRNRSGILQQPDISTNGSGQAFTPATSRAMQPITDEPPAGMAYPPPRDEPPAGMMIPEAQSGIPMRSNRMLSIAGDRATQTATAPAPAQPTGTKYPLAVYVRAKQIKSAGADPAAALGQAISEYQFSRQGVMPGPKY